MDIRIKQLKALAEEGNREWIALYKDYAIGVVDYICFIPFYSDTFTYYSLLYLKEFSEKCNENKIFVITDHPIVEKVINHLNMKVTLISLETNKLYNLLNYYNLYMFSDKLYIFSPILPSNRTAYHLVEQGLIDIEEFISIAILKNNNFERASKWKYDGNDQQLVDFFKSWKVVENIEL